MDAAAVCHTLGFPGYVRLTTCPSGLGGFKPVWLDQLSCRATDQTVADCPASTYGIHTCLGHGSDVGVECAGGCLTVTFCL